MLVGFDDPDIKVFPQELAKLGWSEGHNIRIDYLCAPAGTQVQALAKDLVALEPDVIFSQSRPATAALQRATNTIPIVLTQSARALLKASHTRAAILPASWFTSRV
jgi:putative ABC transport system substrate-binding protein